ncbi:hypothetical protein D917_06435 [Trichinella nativa]|uniref:Uncharacterized protein n=1 Tax=Trichinella nativa TaxID=6335 RepID=A0A1Y3ESC7_9BILA|nr:hypothetical protein D917_06435 [Trichinella nativa]
MDRGSNESGRVWNILWQRESTLSPFTYQKVLCRRPLGQWLLWIEELEVIIWITFHRACIQVHIEDNDMIDVLALIKGLSLPRLEFMAALVRSRLIIYAKRELAMSIPHSDRCVESAFAINYG